MNKKEAKDIEYYAACVNAFIQTRMEKNKQMITLSGLGIGLLVTLRDEVNDHFSLSLWSFSGLLFLISIGISLLIFSKNADYILSDVTGNTDERALISKSLKRKSRALDICFLLAVLATLLFSFYSMNVDLTVSLEFENER